MKCERCENFHNGGYGSGRFCSARCARSFSTSINREELNRKVSLTLKGRQGHSKNKGKHWPIDSKIAVNEANRRKNDSLNFDCLSIKEKRKRIFKEQDYKCLVCKITNWNDKKIIFELNHIDGNRENWLRENLEFLCPNCHSQTITDRFVGRKHTTATKELLRQRAYAFWGKTL